MSAQTRLTQDTVTNRQRAAARIPAPAPGRVVNVPLSLWLDYLRLHNLEVVGRKGDAILTRRRGAGPQAARA